MIKNNTLPLYNKIQEIVNQTVNLFLLKIEDLEQKTKILEILSQVEYKIRFFFIYIYFNDNLIVNIEF